MLVVTLLFFGLHNPITAQRCNYKKLLEEADNAARSEQYALAIRLFNEARDCNPVKTRGVSARISDMVDRLESQRYVVEQQRRDCQLSVDSCNKNVQILTFRADSLGKALQQQMQLTALMDWQNGKTWIYREGKFALIDMTGKQLTDFIYENPKPYLNSNATIATRDNAYHVLDGDGKTLRTYDFMMPTNNGWYRVRQKNQHTFLNQSLAPVGRWTWYDAIQDFSMGLAAVKKDGLWGYADHFGNVMIRSQFNTASSFTKDSFAVVSMDTACGLVNLEGNILWQIKADWIGDFRDDVALFRTNGKYGLVNKMGGKILEAQFDNIMPMTKETTDSLGQVWRVYDKDKQGLYQNDGKILVKVAFDSIENFTNGVARVVKDKKWGYVARSGKAITPPQYKVATRYVDGVAVVKNGRKWELLNAKGKAIKELDIDKIAGEETGFVDGLLPVEQRRKWGYINTRGNLAVPYEYREVSPFSEGKATVKLDDGRRGVIDMSGNLFFSIQVDDLRFLENDLTAFEKNGLWGIMNLRGKVVSPAQYNAIHQKTASILVVEKNRRFGFIQVNGQTVIEPQYDGVLDNFKGENARVRWNGADYHINRKGQIVVKQGNENLMFTRQTEGN
jgi:WG containing repeat